MLDRCCCPWCGSTSIYPTVGSSEDYRRCQECKRMIRVDHLVHESTKQVRMYHKEEKGWRTIVPKRIFFGSNERFSNPQWLLEAFDVNRQEDCTFALSDITAWWTPKE